jgi:uncharacterized membrane protein
MAHEREASVERIIVFSDGVVAIAITLLILDLGMRDLQLSTVG